MGLSAAPLLDAIRSLGFIGAVLGGTWNPPLPCKVFVPPFWLGGKNCLTYMEEGGQARVEAGRIRGT